MSSKLTVAGLILLVLFGITPRETAFAADWTVSPYRAIMAQSDAPTEGATDSISAPETGKKNIGRGVMFSLIIPGAGQLYSGSWLRAVPWFVIEVAGWAAYASFHGKGQDKTDEYEAYAGPRETPNNFSYRSYMYAEWTVAKNTGNSSGTKFTGSFDAWQGLSWEERLGFLQAPFTHDILDDDRQQYFEMIGKYFHQFGWGWRDTYNGGNGGDANDNSWLNPASGLRPDDPATISFDGESPMFFHYADMRGDANDFYDKANIAMEVVLVNHVVSALDAAFAVRSYNKKLAAQPVLGDMRLRYNAQRVNGDNVRYLTLSVPLP